MTTETKEGRRARRETGRRAAPPDILDQLAQGDPLEVIALMLWKARHREPDMYVRIDANDIRAFQDCCRYLKVDYQVQIVRPAAIPASPALPAHGNRRAVPARPEIPARPYVMVKLVERGTEHVIRPVENNQADFDTAADAATVRKARDQASDLAQRLVNQAASGEYSASDMTDAANALLLLARAQS